MFLKYTSRVLLLNRYYRMTGFYTFLRNTAYRTGLTLVFFVLAIVALELFVLDINTFLNTLVESYEPQLVLTFFLASETVLGLVPPEIFIAWATKSSNPWLFLFILAGLSYIGGVISYFVGTRLFLIPSIKSYMELKAAKHIQNLRKWGGLFVLLGAVSPVPHSMVSMASGLINYNFKHYLLWSLFRFLRFVVYAVVIFRVL